MCNKCNNKNNWKKLFARVMEHRKSIWYVLLVLFGFAYVWFYRNELYDLNELNAKNLIFILWLLLLLLPLFSELEFLGVKIKKEVEKATGEIKESVSSLQTQIMQLSINNSVVPTFYIGSNLPTQEEMKKATEAVAKAEDFSNEKNDNIQQKSLLDSEYKNMYILKVRQELEILLRRICGKVGFQDSTSIQNMMKKLMQIGLLDVDTYDSINYVFSIVNRGFHGEIISNEYIEFIENVFPKIKNQLEVEESKLTFTVCPRCKYTGFSKFENVCPQCGYVYDDY